MTIFYPLKPVFKKGQEFQVIPPNPAHDSAEDVTYLFNGIAVDRSKFYAEYALACK